MNPNMIPYRPRVLIVEDETLVAEELGELLEEFGFSVIAAVDSAEESVVIATEELPDLILMDIRLKGGKDGVWAAKTIRQQVDLPIVYLTAYSDRLTVDRARGSSHDAYLLKPFQRRELLSTVEIAMKRHALRTKRTN